MKYLHLHESGRPRATLDAVAAALPDLARYSRAREAAVEEARSIPIGSPEDRAWFARWLLPQECFRHVFEAEEGTIGTSLAAP